MKDRFKILIIEDESDMIDLLRLILERSKFEVVGAVGGRKGLDLVRAERPDLILLDLMMPHLNGWEVYRQLKTDSELKGIPVIVITVRPRDDDETLGTRIAKVDGYITKPFRQQELLDNIHRVLERN